MPPLCPPPRHAAAIGLSLLLVVLAGGCEREPADAPEPEPATPDVAAAPPPHEPTTRLEPDAPDEPDDGAVRAAAARRLSIAARTASVVAGAPAAQQPEVVYLEPRERAAGPCGAWPAALDPVGSSARAALDELLPDGALVGAVRSDRATVQTRLTGPHKVRVLYSAGPDCEVQRSRSTTASTPGRPQPAPPTPTVGVPPVPDPDAADAPPPPPEWYLADIELRDLTPNTRYRYRVVVDGQGEGPWGTFTTAPVEDVPVRIAFAADIFSRDEFLELLPEVHHSAPDVLVAMGDWPYADAAPPAKTLDEFRGKHAESRGLAPIQELMRTTGVLAMWDDHEVTNDWDGRDAEREPDLVAAGVKAWHERFPTRGVPDEARDTGANYRRVSWGPDVELFLLDTRTFRDRNSRHDDARKTLLGDAQLAWLRRALTDSQATFKVIVSSVPLVQATTRDDSWSGFRTERDALMASIVETGIDGVVVVSGDQHWLAVHHTPWGIQEFQVGPTAAFLRSPRPAPPTWVRLQREALNYGLLDYEPARGDAPATLTFRAIGPGDQILWEETVSRAHGRVEIVTASPWIGWRLEGPHTFEGTGSVTLPRVPAGRYRMTWLPRVPGTADLPAASTIEVESGESVSLRNGSRPTMPPMVYDGFDALSAVAEPIAWRAVDDGRHGTPSRWQRVGDTMAQLAPVRDLRELPETRSDSPRDLLREGTWLTAGDLTVGDMTLEVDVFPGDEDGWGVMWAIDTSQDAPHYLRVDFDRARGGWRIVEVRDGAARLVAEDLDLEAPGPRWVHLRVVRRGDKHTVALDGEVLWSGEVPDAPPHGGIALWSWSMTDVRFDDLVVLP